MPRVNKAFEHREPGHLAVAAHRRIPQLQRDSHFFEADRQVFTPPALGFFLGDAFKLLITCSVLPSPHHSNKGFPRFCPRVQKSFKKTNGSLVSQEENNVAGPSRNFTT
jgi:hypothetical protein